MFSNRLYFLHISNNVITIEGVNPILVFNNLGKKLKVHRLEIR